MMVFHFFCFPIRIRVLGGYNVMYKVDWERGEVRPHFGLNTIFRNFFRNIEGPQQLHAPEYSEEYRGSLTSKGEGYQDHRLQTSRFSCPVGLVALSRTVGVAKGCLSSVLPHRLLVNRMLSALSSLISPRNSNGQGMVIPGK